MIDPDTATVLLLKVPVLKAVFWPELERNDRPMLVQVVDQLLTDDDKDATDLWHTYDCRLHGLGAWAEATRQLRQAAIEMGVFNDK